MKDAYEGICSFAVFLLPFDVDVHNRSTENRVNKIHESIGVYDGSP